MEKTQRISVSINFGEKGTVYGCGHALDTMLYAYGLTTEDSLWEWSADAEHDAIEYVLREYDWEAYTLERLNALETPSPNNEYLYGDWMRFEQPGAFIETSKEDKKRITGYVWEELGDWSSDHIPADLRKELTRAYNATQEDIQREWLHGDRSSEGVLRRLACALFGRYTDAEVEWDQKTDTVTIHATADEWREWMGYDLGENDPLPDSTKLGEHVRDVTLYKAQGVKEKQRIANESRQRERARLEERKRLQEEEEKEAARQRKLKKIQAS